MLNTGKPASKYWAAIFWILTVGWFALLFFFAGQNAEDSGAVSGRFAEFLMKQLYFIDIDRALFEHFLRKAAHFCIFAIEGMFLRAALYNTRSRRRVNTLLALGVMLTLSVANEAFQLTAAGRGCSVVDMGIDFAGAATGVLFSSLLCWISESIYIRKRFEHMLRRKRT